MNMRRMYTIIIYNHNIPHPLLKTLINSSISLLKNGGFQGIESPPKTINSHSNMQHLFSFYIKRVKELPPLNLDLVSYNNYFYCLLHLLPNHISSPYWWGTQLLKPWKPCSLNLNYWVCSWMKDFNFGPTVEQQMGSLMMINGDFQADSGLEILNAGHGLGANHGDIVNVS